MSAPDFWFDFEAASLRDLKAVGTFRYATDASTRAIVLAYAVGDGPVSHGMPTARFWIGTTRQTIFAPPSIAAGRAPRGTRASIPTSGIIQPSDFPSSRRNASSMSWSRPASPICRPISKAPRAHSAAQASRRTARSSSSCSASRARTLASIPTNGSVFSPMRARTSRRCVTFTAAHDRCRSRSGGSTGRLSASTGAAWLSTCRSSRRAATLAAEDAIAIGRRLVELTGGAVTRVTQAKRIAAWLHDQLPDAEMREVLTVGAAADDDDEGDGDGDGDDQAEPHEHEFSLTRARVARVLAMLEAKRANGGLDPAETKAHEVATLRLYGAGASPRKFARIAAQQVEGVLRDQYRFAGAPQTGRMSSRGAADPESSTRRHRRPRRQRSCAGRPDRRRLRLRRAGRSEARSTCRWRASWR